MLDHVFIESILREIILSRKKLELRSGNKGEEKGLNATMGTVALDDHIQISLSFKFHFSAVASTGIGFHKI